MSTSSLPSRSFVFHIAGALFALGLSASAAAQTCGIEALWVPPGSAATPQGSALDIRPPDGFTYVGYDGDQQLYAAAADIKCSCDCTSSSGNCSPSIFNGKCSCTASGGCTSCTLTTSASVAGTGAQLALHRGGFIDRQAGVSVTEETSTDRPLAFRAMFDLPEVRQALDEFLGGYPEVYSGDLPNTNARVTIPEGYAAVPLNVFGRSAFIVVAAYLAPGAAAGGGGSCSCTSGSCTYNSTWTPKGTLHYCEGNCSGTCTLSMSSASSQVTFEAMKAAH
jgi:hypothetical protein